MNTHFIVPLILFGSLILIMLVFIIIIFLILHKQRTQRYKLKLKETTYQYQKELLNTRIEVQEQALDWVSREIHDNVAQVLGITMHQLVHDTDGSTREELVVRMAEAGERIGTSLKDLHDLSHMINGEMIEKVGLEKAIKNELSYIRNIHKIEGRFYCSGVLALTSEQELLLFRITQEALNNIVKHSEATQTRIDIVRKDNSLEMRIEDNGIGMDVNNCTEQGMGLSNIRLRTGLLNGTLLLHSGREEGTTILIKLNDILNGRHN